MRKRHVDLLIPVIYSAGCSSESLLTWGLSFPPGLGEFPKHVHRSGQAEPFHPCHPIPPTCTRPKSRSSKTKSTRYRSTILKNGALQPLHPPPPFNALVLLLSQVLNPCSTTARSRRFQDQTGTPWHQFQFISYVSLTLTLLPCNPLSERGIKL